MNTLQKTLTFTGIIAISILLLLSGCKEEDKYNFDEIEPRLIDGISGPKKANATGFTEYKYSVLHRGGSSYNWSANNEDLVVSIKKDPDYPNHAIITFSELHDTSEINITVKETTSGGKTASATDSVELLPFCPYPINEYTGNWLSTDTINVAKEVAAQTAENPNQLKVYGLADFITSRWGETWINGDGSCIIELCCNDKVEIERQWLGDTDYPDTYEIQGNGTVDTEAKTISLTYDIFYADGIGSKHVNTTLSLQ